MNATSSSSRSQFAIDHEIVRRRKEKEERAAALMKRGFSEYEATYAVLKIMRNPDLFKKGVTEEGVARALQKSGKRQKVSPAE